MHDELQSAFAARRGLVLVTGPTGHGKTTAVEAALADPSVRRDVAFLGDVRGDLALARRAVALARDHAVVAVLRIARAASSFARLIDLGIPATKLAPIVRVAFSTRLVRSAGIDRVLLHERLVVTAAIRALIVAGADPDAIHHQAMVEGMRSLRQVGLDEVKTGRLTFESVRQMTPDD